MASTRNGSRWANWLKTVRNPPQYLTASLIISLGGLLNGLDTGTIGPVTAMPSFADTFGVLSPSLHGLVISSILLPATFTSLFSGALSDSLGRTRAVAIGAIFFAIGAALEASAFSIGMFIAGRCVVGIGEGLFLSTLVVYVCEISPPSKRGPLATLVQVFITIGLCVGYFTCYGTVRLPSSLSWRLPLALQSGIALFLGATSFFYLPHSPRWLAYKGRREEASLAWDKLGVSNAEREKDLLQNPASMVDAAARPAVAPKVDLLNRIRDNLVSSVSVFRKNTRKPMYLGVFMMSMQQLSGIDGVIYYAPLLFRQAGIASSKATFLASGISAILIFVFTILALLLVDRWGRRPTTIYGGLVLSASWAIAVKLFASEIQPAATRATATSLAQSANCMTNFFVAFITPVLLSRSSSGIYFLFGGTSILTVAVCAVCMPETRGRDLEAIGETFGLHRAMDMPMARRLRSLGSQLRRMVGVRSEPRRLPEVDRGIELVG
ncbi:hypothetical protein MMC16_004735 [Acarospora aff. strigata]|nr:hypothetical protein [Acarospora aff. strigata]